MCKSLIVTLLLLSGCATTKPELSNADASRIVSYWAVTQKCGQQGLISPEIAATGILLLKNELSTFSYDATDLNIGLSKLMSDGRTAPELGCRQMAIVISERKQQIEMANRLPEPSLQQGQERIDNNKIINSYCNRIANQTLCTSY